MPVAAGRSEEHFEAVAHREAPGTIPFVKVGEKGPAHVDAPSSSKRGRTSRHAGEPILAEPEPRRMSPTCSVPPGRRARTTKATFQCITVSHHGHRRTPTAWKPIWKPEASYSMFRILVQYCVHSEKRRNLEPRPRTASTMPHRASCPTARLLPTPVPCHSRPRRTGSSVPDREERRSVPPERGAADKIHGSTFRLLINDVAMVGSKRARKPQAAEGTTGE